MSYRDRYKPASFRGVPFFVKMAEMPFGRRSETHEYPQRDEPYTEDLGRQAREFTVSAYICIGPTFGDDYITARDRLIDAIEKDGSAGTLILPTHAPQQVVPKPCRVRYDGDNGGVEYLELVFTEAGKNAFPNASGVDTAGVVNSRADDAVEAIKQIFGEAFTVEDLPAFVSDDAQTIASDLVTALRDAAGSRVPITDDFADYTDSVDTFEGDIATVVTDPDDFADQVTTLVAGILDIYEDPRDAYTAYVDLYSFGDDLAEINPTTTTRQQQKDNREGLIRITKRAAIVGMAKAAALMEYESYDDAVTVRDALSGRMDDQLDIIGDTDEDDAFIAIADLRAATVRHVTDTAANLKRTETRTNNAPMPALVMAYDIYEDATQDADIVARNKVRNPNFLPAGQPLRVLVG